jgi:hypothetical protein
MAATVIEWAPFRLLPGTTEQTLLDAADAIQRDFLASQPGLVRRELLRGKDGQWVDLLHWQDDEAARAAMARAAESPVCHRYFALMGAEAGEGVLHLTRVREY